MRLHTLLAAALVTTWLPCAARVGAAQPPGADRTVAPPVLYLSCPLTCFEDYLKQELSYFDFSRDPYRAEFTIVVVRQAAGNGGERFSVLVSRSEQVASQGATEPLGFTVQPGTPDVEARATLVQAVLRALQAELAETSHAAAFQLALPKRSGATLSVLRDAWDYWTVTPELSAEGEGGSGYHFIEGTAGVTVRRVTEPHKLRVRLSHWRRFSGYLLEDGSRIRGNVGGWDGRALYAWALGRRGALGVVGTARASGFENLAGHLHGGPLGELNLFPYADNASQQLRLAYQAGAWVNWYLEPSQRGRLRELKPYHALSFIVDVNQPWGSAQWIAQINQFLDEPARYRVSVGAIASLRLAEGLAISLEGEAALVRDQINLRGRPITDRELLLWTVEQPTAFTYEGVLLLSYTFGSIHNTLVNPRFARVDLDEE